MSDYLPKAPHLRAPSPWGWNFNIRIWGNTDLKAVTVILEPMLSWVIFSLVYLCTFDCWSRLGSGYQQLIVFVVWSSLCIGRKFHPFAGRCFPYYKVKKKSTEFSTDIYWKVNCLCVLGLWVFFIYSCLHVHPSVFFFPKTDIYYKLHQN